MQAKPPKVLIGTIRRSDSDSSREHGSVNTSPTVLQGRRLKPRVLPRDYDTSVHEQARQAGNVKATSLTDLTSMIRDLKWKMQVG